MDLTSFRKSRGLSLQACADELGLSSRGYLHDLEGGRTPVPLWLAVKIEEWSGGAVRPADLLHDEARSDDSRATDESLEAQP